MAGRHTRQAGERHFPGLICAQSWTVYRRHRTRCMHQRNGKQKRSGPWQCEDLPPPAGSSADSADGRQATLSQTGPAAGHSIASGLFTGALAAQPVGIAGTGGTASRYRGHRRGGHRRRAVDRRPATHTRPHGSDHPDQPDQSDQLHQRDQSDQAPLGEAPTEPWQPFLLALGRILRMRFISVNKRITHHCSFRCLDRTL